MDVVFFGSGAFGLPTLRALAREHRVKAVITQPDRPAGRGGQKTATPIGQFAAESLEGAQLFKPENVNIGDVRDAVREVEAQAWVVIAYGQKMSESLLSGVFAINLHASLLPRWRGAAPINAAIITGDTETGNSVITLADRMDAGFVLGQTCRAIKRDITAGQLHDELSEDGPELVLDVLRQHSEGRIVNDTQDESAVTLASKLSKRDRWIDFSDSADVCRCRINGLSPWPSVTANFRSEPLKLLRSECGAVESESNAVPGTIVDVTDGIVACGEGMIRLLEVQPAGKRAMSWEAYARGRHVEVGERIEGSTRP